MPREGKWNSHETAEIVGHKLASGERVCVTVNAGYIENSGNEHAQYVVALIGDAATAHYTKSEKGNIKSVLFIPTGTAKETPNLGDWSMAKELLSKNLSATEAFERVAREAESKSSQEVRFIEKMEVGKVVRQGDLYVHCVESSHPKGKQLPITQLVPGVSQGSRHCVDGGRVFEGKALPKWMPNGRSDVVMGPVVENGERFTVTHPEHAHVSLPPGCYQVTYQLDAQSLQRVQD